MVGHRVCHQRQLSVMSTLPHRGAQAGKRESEGDSVAHLQRYLIVVDARSACAGGRGRGTLKSGGTSMCATMSTLTPQIQSRNPEAASSTRSLCMSIRCMVEACTGGVCRCRRRTRLDSYKGQLSLLCCRQILRRNTSQGSGAWSPRWLLMTLRSAGATRQRCRLRKRSRLLDRAPKSSVRTRCTAGSTCTSKLARAGS